MSRFVRGCEALPPRAVFQHWQYLQALVSMWWNGRHACLRCMWRELWGFKSPRRHFVFRAFIRRLYFSIYSISMDSNHNDITKGFVYHFLVSLLHSLKAFQRFYSMFLNQQKMTPYSFT